MSPALYLIVSVGCVCVCDSDWFLFYGLASRALVNRTNKSALFDLSANTNKTLYYCHISLSEQGGM